jgi:hypothetical protein
MRVQHTPIPDLRISTDDNMRMKNAEITDRRAWADDSEGSDRAIVAKVSFDRGGGIDLARTRHQRRKVVD